MRRSRKEEEEEQKKEKRRKEEEEAGWRCFPHGMCVAPPPMHRYWLRRHLYLRAGGWAGHEEVAVVVVVWVVVVWCSTTTAVAVATDGPHGGSLAV